MSGLYKESSLKTMNSALQRYSTTLQITLKSAWLFSSSFETRVSCSCSDQQCRAMSSNVEQCRNVSKDV